MSEQDKHEQQDERQEQADLEVSEELAEEVEGGGVRSHGADRDPQGAKAKF